MTGWSATRLGLPVLESFVSTLHHERWMSEGACVGCDPEAWFPTPGHSSIETARALLICEHCPVANECFEYAMSFPYRVAGIWGGTTTLQRRRAHSRARAAAENRSAS